MDKKDCVFHCTGLNIDLIVCSVCSLDVTNDCTDCTRYIPDTEENLERIESLALILYSGRLFEERNGTLA